MKIHILRNTEEARQFLLQGLWWQRVLTPTAATVREALLWAKELISEGHPIPPLGFLADVGHLAIRSDWERRDAREHLIAPVLPMTLVRTYEDQVLGKLYVDHSFSRASDALHKYSKDSKTREQSRGLAYLLTKFRDRACYDAVEFPIGVINALIESSLEEVLVEGFESMRLEGLHPLLPTLYESLIQACRRISTVLGAEDLFELEVKLALEKEGQRLANRQVIRAASMLDATLPQHKVRPLKGRQEVPTRILDEDSYPVGGFTSISNRGSIESLLQSQLAYMEPESGEHPDLFDTLFLMDELLYYSRDENQFLRRRRTFVVALCDDLIEARFKDAELPYQRIVLLLGLLHVVVKRICAWLSTDALKFQILFLVKEGQPTLSHEQGLIEKMFHEELATGVVQLSQLQEKQLSEFCEQWARKSMCHCLVLGVRPPTVQARNVVVTRLAIPSARPALADGSTAPTPLAGEEAFDSWADALHGILMRWI